MCGISGVYARIINEQHQQLINAIIKYQISRGPDFSTSLFVKAALAETVLGHNRLSIIDLSQHANQPMWDVTKRFCIVFNGEIYNYVELRDDLKKHGLFFQTKSDTEVILNAFAHWGIDALQYFRGPFAFALFDVEKSEIWLCRDRFGVRPLYYVIQNNILYFASSVKVLASHFNLKPNLHYIAKGLRYLVYEDGSEISPYEQLYALPSACFLHAKLNNATLKYSIKAYYDLTANVQNCIDTLSASSSSDFFSKITDRFTTAVQLRLRTDVPLAISLSGGLDSSSVAALVKQNHEQTIGFSFGHPSHRVSEGAIVANCANFLNIKMHYVWPSTTEMVAAFEKTLSAQEAPFSSFSIVAQYLLYKKVRQEGVKVLLGGQGGDEAFMGYRKFLLFSLQQQLRQQNYFHFAKQLFYLIPMLFAEMKALPRYFQHRHRYTKKNQLDNSVLNLPNHSLDLNNVEPELWKRQSQDIMRFSLPTLLRYEDRNAMAHSVESRLPFLDHELIELALALPESLKIHRGYGKWIMREIMHDKIPDAIRMARYKRGFDVPLQTLLKHDLGKYIRAQLEEKKQNISEFLRQPNKINEIFSDQQLLSRPNAMGEAISLLWLAST